MNFGGHGNQWDHASRLERMTDVEIVGIADLNVAQAQKVLDIRKAKPDVCHKWQHTKIFSSYEEMIREVSPSCVIIGVPPAAHGSAQRPIEINCAKAGVHMLIEKPISSVHPDQMTEVEKELTEGSARNGLVVSVAYMFRYSKAVQKVRELVQTYGPVRSFQARYNCAYSKIGPFWWDTKASGGPIVEQATHFIDLSRYLCGDAVDSTVQAMSIKATDPLGALSAMPIDESTIPPERRVPRATTAIWRFAGGAIGSLTHTVLLHGWAYNTEIELLGDGYQIILRDPYGKCQIDYREPGSETTKTIHMPDDPYQLELETFIEACKNNDPTKVASPYADALKTHKLAWAIRTAADVDDTSASPADAVAVPN